MFQLSGYEYLKSIELRNEARHTLKSIQKFVNLRNLRVVGLNAKECYTFKKIAKIRELSMD